MQASSNVNDNNKIVANWDAKPYLATEYRAEFYYHVGKHWIRLCKYNIQIKLHRVQDEIIAKLMFFPPIIMLINVC